MLNSRPLDELAARIGQAFENSPAKDIEKNIKGLLSSGLSRLDVVPRAEFDVQSQVLLRTREKLEALERRVLELEARSSTHAAPSTAPGTGADATLRDSVLGAQDLSSSTGARAAGGDLGSTVGGSTAASSSVAGMPHGMEGGPMGGLGGPGGVGGPPDLDPLKPR